MQREGGAQPALGDDIADDASHNDLATAVLLAELAARRFRGRVVLAPSMVVYGEGRYRCPRHGSIRSTSLPATPGSRTG